LPAITTGREYLAGIRNKISIDYRTSGRSDSCFMGIWTSATSREELRKRRYLSLWPGTSFGGTEKTTKNISHVSRSSADIRPLYLQNLYTPEGKMPLGIHRLREDNIKTNLK